MMINCKTINHAFRIKTGFAGLTEEELQVARAEAEKQQISLLQSILKLGVISESELLTAAAKELKTELISLLPEDIESQAIQAVSANIASYYNIVPLKVVDQTLYVATCDPFNPGIKEELELVLDSTYEVKLLLTNSEAIRKAIRKSYGVGADTIEQMTRDEEIVDSPATPDNLLDETKAYDASIIKLVNQLLADAISVDATDIHIEPYEKELRTRYRIDGVLYDTGIPKTIRHFRDGIASRIKIISGLDIAEKRLPQDGRAQVNLLGHKFDLRVSVLPTRYGEAINIRILPQNTQLSDLLSLGMPVNIVSNIKNLISKPHGIILVTGPTGSGKTTTLYACMNILKNTHKKVITIEDPIEYDTPGIIQMQVHPDIGFTFARALRSMLRHDPDIMLIGEIRDLETAQTAIRTALTGHLIFSTLHTNNAASAITRLLDMGIEPYLIASSVEAVLAQRLVRVICPNCKKPHEPDSETVTAIKSLLACDSLAATYRGQGCSKCRFTGYHGRIAIAELLMLSESIREMTLSRTHSEQIDSQARHEGMTSLFISGIKKVAEGITTYEEVLRVTKGAVLME